MVAMDELLIQHIWQHALYDSRNMHTTDGLAVEVVAPGMQNSDAGPDFMDSRVKIGTTLWAGCVEIHRKSSDWNQHRHSENRLYDNVILHVVVEHDMEICTRQGEPIPVLQLKFHPKIEENYQNLFQSRRWIPCEDKFGTVDSSLRSMWIESLAVERLERKSIAIVEMLNETNGHYNEVFYRLLAINFGFKTNAIPFEMLSRQLSLQTLTKISGNPMAIEAALFGQAGFLESTPVDAYQEGLQKEFQLLKHRFVLTPIDKGLWKFFRLRPANFPTIRLAQLSALLSRSVDFIGLIQGTKTVDQLHNYFLQPIGEYWQTHISFGQKSKRRYVQLGTKSVEIVIINTVIPFLFVYGQQHDDDTLKQLAFEWLEDIQAEENTIVRKWQDLGADIQNARQSQAYLELKNEYCNHHRCLECPIGCALVADVG